MDNQPKVWTCSCTGTFAVVSKEAYDSVCSQLNDYKSQLQWSLKKEDQLKEQLFNEQFRSAHKIQELIEERDQLKTKVNELKETANMYANEAERHAETAVTSFETVVQLKAERDQLLQLVEQYKADEIRLMRDMDLHVVNINMLIDMQKELREAAEKLAEALEHMGKTLQVPAAEYVPAIPDAWVVQDKALAEYRAKFPKE